MKKNLLLKLENGYSIFKMSSDEFFELQAPLREEVFESDHSVNLHELLTVEEKDQIKRLQDIAFDSPYSLYLGLFDNQNEFVGWSFGFQKDRFSFYMCNSAVLKGHRRKGLYTSLMNSAIEEASSQGFQIIYSRHNASNNSVIIPKLKAGFIFSSMEIDDVFGVLVHLKYYTNKTRRKIMDYRCGQQAPDKELKNLFNL